MIVELKDVEPKELERFAQALKDELPDVPMEKFEPALRRALDWAGCHLQVNSDGANNVWIRKP